MINLKDFESHLLNIEKKGINTYCTEYISIKKIDDCESIYSVNPSLLQVNDSSRYIDDKNGNNFLILQMKAKNY